MTIFGLGGRGRATATAKASAKTKANAGVLRYAQNDNCFGSSQNDNCFGSSQNDNCFWVRRVRVKPRSSRRYSIAPYASVQKSVNTFGGSGESIMRWVKRMPIISS